MMLNTGHAPYTQEDIGVSPVWWRFSGHTDHENFAAFLEARYGKAYADMLLSNIFDPTPLLECREPLDSSLDKARYTARLLRDWERTHDLAATSGPRWDWARFKELRDTLLSVGGVETCFFDPDEPDMQSILSRGRFWNGTSKMMKGRDNNCHSNVCALWDQNRGAHNVHICTGYALSDGIWRQHSWLLHKYKTPKQCRQRIVETTTKRELYFGFEMTEEEAIRFCENNF